jgi:hypothetical protein
MRHARLTALVASLVAAASAPAAAQTVNFVPGTPFNSPNLTGFETTGSLMVGMQVTVDFALGGVQSGAWSDLGGGSCGVSFGGFTLTLGCGTDTFGGNWTLNNDTNDRVRGVRLNGAPGRTLFDVSGGSSTPGSANGLTLNSVGGTYTGSVFGTYANLVGVGGSAPVGDLYEQLTIRFGDVLGAGQTYIFEADTDNSSFDAPPPVTVPEPATFALTVLGLVSLGGVARRRRQTA